MRYNLNMRHSESGNALFYILIAVALIGALSFAVANSGRGNVQQLSAERARLVATQILEYTDTLGNAVTQLKLRGCADTEISFENPVDTSFVNPNAPADESCHIFSPNGGGLRWQTVPIEAQDASTLYHDGYYINATNNIAGTKSNQGDLAVYTEVNLQVCETLNTLTNVEPASPPNEETTFHNHIAFKFKGSYSAPSGVDEAYPGAQIACFTDTGGSENRHYFFRTLISR